MIANTCPYCGSTDWNYEDKITEFWMNNAFHAYWVCHCNKCYHDFRRVERYKLVEIKHESF